MTPRNLTYQALDGVVSCSSSVTAIFRKEVKVLDKDIAVQLAVFVLDMSAWDWF